MCALALSRSVLRKRSFAHSRLRALGTAQQAQLAQEVPSDLPASSDNDPLAVPGSIPSPKEPNHFRHPLLPPSVPPPITHTDTGILPTAKPFFTQRSTTTAASRGEKFSSFSKFKCDECWKIFVTKRSLEDHRSTHEHMWSCGVCGATFADCDYLRAHELRMHDRSRPKHICPVCGDGLASKWLLARHLSTLPFDHTSVAGSRFIDLSPEDLNSLEVFEKGEPILEQSLQHSTTIRARRKIEQSNSMHPDPHAETDAVYTGILSHADAPASIFFNAFGDSDLTFPRLVQFPEDAEPDELLGTLLVDLPSLLERSGEFRLYFCGSSCPKVVHGAYQSPVRVVLLIAHKDGWETIESLGGAHMDLETNKVLYRDADSGKFHVSPRMVQFPRRELSIIVAVSGAIDNLQEAGARWLEVAKTAYWEDKPMCPICDLTFDGRKTLYDHFRVTHEHKRFHCHICPSSYERRNALSEHIRSKHTRGSFIPCPNCSRKFTKQFELEQHMRSQHDGVRENCIYDGCDMTFSRKAYLRQHIRAVHEGEGHCKICDKRSPTPYKHREHMAKVHNVTIAPSPRRGATPIKLEREDDFRRSFQENRSS